MRTIYIVVEGFYLTWNYEFLQNKNAWNKKDVFFDICNIAILINMVHFRCAAHNRHLEQYRVLNHLIRQVTCISTDTAVRILRHHNGLNGKTLSVVWQWETVMEKPAQVVLMLICINICLSIIIRSQHNTSNTSLNHSITSGKFY